MLDLQAAVEKKSVVQNKLFVCFEGIGKSPALANHYEAKFLQYGFRPLMDEYMKLQKNKTFQFEQFEKSLSRAGLTKENEIILVLEDEDQGEVAQGLINVLLAHDYDVTVMFEHDMFQDGFDVNAPGWQKTKEKLKKNWNRFHRQFH